MASSDSNVNPVTLFLTLAREYPSVDVTTAATLWVLRSVKHENSYQFLNVDVNEIVSFLEEHGHVIKHFQSQPQIVVQSKGKLSVYSEFLMSYLLKIDPDVKSDPLFQAMEDLVYECQVLEGKRIMSKIVEKLETSLSVLLEKKTPTFHLKKVCHADVVDGKLTVSESYVTSDAFEKMQTHYQKIKQFLGMNDEGKPNVREIFVKKSFMSSMPAEFAYLELYYKEDNRVVLSDEMLFTDDFDNIHQEQIINGFDESNFVFKQVMIHANDFEILSAD